MLELEELMSIHHTLLGHLRATQPDYIVLEIADGIFQRETRMLLEHVPFTSSVDHVFFAANDSLSAACGVRELQQRGLPLRAVAGALTQSPLAMREAEAASGMPCFSIERMLGPDLLELLHAQPVIATPSGQALQEASVAL
jgi:hypothetical protein